MIKCTAANLASFFSPGMHKLSHADEIAATNAEADQLQTLETGWRDFYCDLPRLVKEIRSM